MSQNQMLRKVILGLCFFVVVIAVTAVTTWLGEITNPVTVGFGYLILVVISAVFAGLAVAIVTSIIAALFFNYFFMPPIGTFVIADFHNWVALFAFLFTSIVISRLTASAHENAKKYENLNLSLSRLKEFGAWLLSMPREMLTLTGIAEGAVRIFSLQYCSIHVYAEGKWHHFSGTSMGELSRFIADSLKSQEDHPTGILELADEQSLGVRYSRINSGEESLALLVVKSDYLTRDAIDSIASMTGVLLSEIIRDARFRSIKQEK